MTSAALRHLYRRCCVLRANLSGTYVDDLEISLARLNVLISITGSYFGQGEEYDQLNYKLYGNNEEDNYDNDYEDEGKIMIIMI